MIHIIDMDDGPEGGGGAALGRLLTEKGIPHKCWVSSTMSSGWDASVETRCVGDEGLAQVIEDAGPDDMFVPTTRAARFWLAEVKEKTNVDFPESLARIMAMPVGVRSLLGAANAELPVVGFEVLSKPPERELCSKLFHGGWVLTDLGDLVALENGEEAWYRICQLFRRSTKSCALIPSVGCSLYIGSHLFVDGEARHATFMRVDSMRPSWRLALGRTVSGRVWDRATSELEHLDIKTGFFKSLWLFGAGRKKARFLASEPTPGAWLEIDGDGLAEALFGSPKRHIAPSGRYYADAPIDLAITCSTLLERSAR